MKTIHFVACLALGFGCVVSLADAGTVRTVAFFLDTNFDAPVLNDAGHTAFIESGGVGSLWSEGSGTGLQRIVLTGNTAPGTGGARFSEFNEGTLVLNDAGQIAFGARLTSVRVSNWSEGGGNGLALVVRKGDAAPGLESGSTFSYRLGSPALNNAGQTAFWAELAGGAEARDNNFGNWLEGGGSGLALVARAGEAAPGTGGANFSGFSGRSPDINDAGQTVFVARITGSGMITGRDTGIWLGGSSGPTLVAREGDVAPGTNNANFGDFFGYDHLTALNGASQTAFRMKLTGPGVDRDNDTGIWSNGQGSGLALIAREGDPAPGAENADFDDLLGFSNRLVFNDSGQTAFHGQLTGTGVDHNNETGIWSEGRGAGLALVAREGDAAPGVDGVNFSLFEKPILNAEGQVAFFGYASGTGVWAQDRSGVLRLIVRLGELFDVDDGPGTDFRIIRKLDFVGGTGNGDGRPSGFNNLGQVAFSASFTDGSSGVFVSNIATIPEPSALLLAALALLGVLAQRRGARC